MMLGYRGMGLSVGSMICGWDKEVTWEYFFMNKLNENTSIGQRHHQTLYMEGHIFIICDLGSCRLVDSGHQS